MLSEPTAPTTTVKHDASKSPKAMVPPMSFKHYSHEDSRPSNGGSKIPINQTSEISIKQTSCTKSSNGAKDGLPRAAN